MSDMQIQQVLAQMRVLAAQAELPNTQAASSGGFSEVLKQSLEQVNVMQQEAAAVGTRFAAGAPDASLTEVVLAAQKASLGFEAVTQVRNRLLAAYQEIMNMPL